MATHLPYTIILFILAITLLLFLSSPTVALPDPPTKNALSALDYVLQAGSQEGSFHTYFDGHFECKQDCTSAMTFDFHGVLPSSLTPRFPLPPPAMLVMYFYSYTEQDSVFFSHNAIWKTTNYTQSSIKPFPTGTEYGQFFVPSGTYVGFYGEITYSNGSSVSDLNSLPQIQVQFVFDLNNDKTTEEQLEMDIFSTRYIHNPDISTNSPLLREMNINKSNFNIQRFRQRFYPNSRPQSHHSNLKLLTHDTTISSGKLSTLPLISTQLASQVTTITSNNFRFARSVYVGDRYSLYFDGIRLLEDEPSPTSPEASYHLHIRVAHTRASFTGFSIQLLGQTATFSSYLYWVDCTAAYGDIDFTFQLFFVSPSLVYGYFTGTADGTFVLHCPELQYFPGVFTPSISAAFSIFNHTTSPALQEALQQRKNQNLLHNGPTTRITKGNASIDDDTVFYRAIVDNYNNILSQKIHSTQNINFSQNDDKTNANSHDPIPIANSDPILSITSISRVTTTIQRSYRTKLTATDTTSIPIPLVMMQPPEGYRLMKKYGVEDGSSWFISALACQFHVYFKNNDVYKITQRQVKTNKERFRITLINGQLVETSAHITVTTLDGTMLAHWSRERNIPGTDLDPYILYEPFSFYKNLDTVMLDSYLINVYAPLVNSTSEKKARNLQCQMIYEVTTRQPDSIDNFSQRINGTDGYSTNTNGDTVFTVTTSVPSLLSTNSSGNISENTQNNTFHEKSEQIFNNNQLSASKSLRTTFTALSRVKSLNVMSLQDGRLFNLPNMIYNDTIQSNGGHFYEFSVDNNSNNDNDNDYQGFSSFFSTLLSPFRPPVTHMFPTHKIFHLQPFNPGNVTFFRLNMTLPPFLRDASKITFEFTNYNYRFYLRHKNITAKTCWFNDRFIAPIFDMEESFEANKELWSGKMTFFTTIYPSSTRHIALSCPGIAIQSQNLWDREQRYPHLDTDYIFPESANILRVEGTNYDSRDIQHKYAQLVPFKHYRVIKSSMTVVYLVIAVGSLVTVILVLLVLRLCLCPYLQKRNNRHKRRIKKRRNQQQQQAQQLLVQNNIDGTNDESVANSSRVSGRNAPILASNYTNNYISDDNFFIALNPDDHADVW